MRSLLRSLFFGLATILVVGTVPLVYFTNLLNTKADTTWYNFDWTYRKKITVDDTQVSGSTNFTNFPVLIDTTDADWKSSGNGGNVEQDDGGDILFTSSDGTTKLNHEIENYDPTTGGLVAWVQIPTLQHNSDSEIYIYYGNQSVSNQQNASETWNTDYMNLWHLAESGNGTIDEYTDSTVNNNHGRGGDGDSNKTPLLVSGKIGNAQSFDGGDYVTVSGAGLQNSQGSVSAWFRSTATGATEYIFASRNGDSANTRIYLLIDSGANPNRLVGVFGEISNRVVSNANLAGDGTWHYAVLTWNSSDNVKLYLDGALQTVTAAHQSFTAGNIERIGSLAQLTPGSYFRGVIEEARILDVALSADWIATEYANQNNPATFYSVGSEETETSSSVTVTQTDGSTAVTEGGSTDTYTLVLIEEPSNSVVVTPTSGNTSTGVTLSPASFTFTTSNWDTPQTVTVTAVDDGVEEGTHTALITHSVSSSDPNYNGISVNSVTVSITDNEPDTTAPSISSISTSNSGTSATITWTTNEMASSQVEYGYTDSYETLTAETDISPRVTSHSVTLTGLNKCRTYHFRVKSTDASGNTTTSSDSNFFTFGCEDVYPGLNASCDNTNPNNYIHVRTDDDLTTVRNAAIEEIWSGDGLPTRQPNTVTIDVNPSPHIDTSVLPNLSRVDQIDIALDKGFNSRIFHLIPTVDNNRLIIYHFGHGGNFEAGESKETIAYFLERGYSVLAVYMPGSQANTGPVGGSQTTFHDNMQTLESDTFNPLEIFLDPVAIALNYTDQNYSYQDTTMVGISGGGWTTHLYAALDPRIGKSFPVAGSLPGFLRIAPCGPGTISDTGDYEQGATGAPAQFFANTASYLDLYILASVGEGRKQIQILNLNDPCCFMGLRFHVYETTVASIASRLGGVFDVASDTTHSEHKVSSWARESVMFPELKQNVIIAESGGSTNVVEGGSTDNYTVALNGKPTASVAIDIASSNPSTGVTVSPSSLTFTRDNWNVPQTITVTAVDDNATEGVHTAIVTHSISSSDEHYNGISASDITANISSASDITANISSPSQSPNESASSSTNHSSSTPLVCSDTIPSSTSWLYGASAKSSSSILLQFSEAADPVSEYVVEYGTEPGNYRFAAANVGGKGTTSYLIQNLSPNITYYFRVRAGNGCATGSWSNEISAKTQSWFSSIVSKSFETELIDVERDMNKDSEESEEPNSCQTYKVQTGDTLSSISQKLLGDGGRFVELIDLNGERYGSLNSDPSSIEVGWELLISCAETEEDKSTEQTKPIGQVLGVNVRLKVVDENKKPVPGAKVTLYSTPREATTDKDGVAHFEGVEPGEHRAVIAYKDLAGEQKINVPAGGEVGEIDFTIQVTPVSPFSNYKVKLVVGALSLGFVTLLLLFLKSRRRS